VQEAAIIECGFRCLSGGESCRQILMLPPWSISLLSALVPTGALLLANCLYSYVPRYLRRFTRALAGMEYETLLPLCILGPSFGVREDTVPAATTDTFSC
jgi:hypothetical protein